MDPKIQSQPDSSPYSDDYQYHSRCPDPSNELLKGGDICMADDGEVMASNVENNQ